MCAALASHIAEAGAEGCWRSWQVLMGEDAGAGLGILDPEALVLASLAFHGVEKRLLDRLQWWASHGTPLLSVQRMKSLAERFPSQVRDKALPWFAHRAALGGDARWKRLAKGAPQNWTEPREGKGPKELALVAPSALLLRMRAGFGVGVKADLLSVLLGVSSVPGFRATASELARTLAYSPGSIRRAAGEMALGGVIHSRSSRPPVFFVDCPSWAQALGIEGTVPTWTFQAEVFAFLAASHAWARMEESSDVVRASHARDLAERFSSLFDGLGMVVPSPAHVRGADYIAVLEGLVESVIDKIEAS